MPVLDVHAILGRLSDTREARNASKGSTTQSQKSETEKWKWTKRTASTPQYMSASRAATTRSASREAVGDLFTSCDSFCVDNRVRAPSCAHSFRFLCTHHPSPACMGACSFPHARLLFVSPSGPGHEQFCSPRGASVRCGSGHDHGRIPLPRLRRGACSVSDPASPRSRSLLSLRAPGLL